MNKVILDKGVFYDLKKPILCHSKVENSKHIALYLFGAFIPFNMADERVAICYNKDTGELYRATSLDKLYIPDDILKEIEENE